MKPNLLAFSFLSGSIIVCNEQSNPKVFDAARCHLGVLGIVLSVKLQVLQINTK